MESEIKKVRKQVRFYVDDEDAKILETLMGKLKTLSETDVVTTLLSAGLAACKNHDYRLPSMPIEFEIVGAPSRSRYTLNETAKRK